MMKVLIVSALLLGFCGLASSALCTKGRRVFQASLRRRKPIENVTQYIVVRIRPQEINSTFTVKIDNGFTVDGEASLVILGKKGKKAEVTGVDKASGVFSLQLTDFGKEKFQKRIARRAKSSLWIPIGIKFLKTFEPKDPNAPRFSEFTLGNFSCTGPKCDLKEPCSQYFNAKDEDTTATSEEGTADLPITTRGEFNLTIGFDTPVEALELTGKLHFKGSDECQQTWRYTDMKKGKKGKKGKRRRGKPKPLKLSKYLIRVTDLSDIPPVSYIEYEDKVCKTSCGIKPVCPTAPATTETPETTTTETPEITTTETPVTTTIEAPPEITITDGIDEIDNLEGPPDDESTWHDLEDELNDLW